LQITDKERENQNDILFKDVANIIAEKCCHPDSKRPFSVDSIKAAMKNIHFSAKIDQSAKK
jgi:ribosome maturation protein Sdo1